MILYYDDDDFKPHYTCPVCGSTCSTDDDTIYCDSDDCSFVSTVDGDEEPFDHDWSDD